MYGCCGDLGGNGFKHSISKSGSLQVYFIFFQFDFQRVIKQFFSTVNYDTDGEGLTISFEFKVDALFDISYLFGFSKRKAEVNGKVLNLFSANEEKRKKVKMFLDKISEPYIRRSSVPDRRMSLFSMGMLLFALLKITLISKNNEVESPNVSPDTFWRSC